MPSVIGLFKRDSIGSISGSRRGSLQSLQHARMDSPRHSIGSDGSINSTGFEMRMAAAQRGDDLETGGSSAGGGGMTSVGVVPRRGSTFLATATPILEEETEETEEREGSRASSSQSSTRPAISSSGGTGNNGASVDSPESSTSPSHSKPTSPSHVSTKPQLQQIVEDEAPVAATEPEPASDPNNDDNDNDGDPHTKL